MALKKFHNLAMGPMRVAGFMSGSGTNLRKILKRQVELDGRGGGGCPYRVVVIFSDTAESRAAQVARDYDLPLVMRDIAAFYAARGRPRRDMKLREEFDRETLKALEPFGVKVAAFAGYMSIASKPLIEGLLAVNVHPADLTIKEGGKRKYRGAHAVRDAIVAGETMLRSTTHIVEAEVDEGRILMVSAPIPVYPEAFPTPKTNLGVEGLSDRVEDLEGRAKLVQERLKEEGDWVIFPLTLQWLAEGRFQYDDSTGALFFDGRPIPDGVRYEEVIGLR